MIRDDIIRLAEEAGVPMERGIINGITYCRFHPAIERFANFVAAAEREACELTVDSLIISGPVSEVQQRHNWAYMHARDAIRARGEQEKQR